MFDTPVAIIIFNRPDLVKGLIDQLRPVAPKNLFVIADGPRHSADEPLVRSARQEIEAINWPANVRRIYSDINLGCKNRVVSGLEEVFRTVDRAIILEDDVWPDETFFTFCEEMLDRYETDSRIFTICSGNFVGRPVPGQSSYHFSLYGSSWGWATWRRTWQAYDSTMALWPQLRQVNWLASHLGSLEEVQFYQNPFDLTHAGQIDTWDYQFLYSCWINNALNIVPNVTLARNVGFNRPDATHTLVDSPAAHVRAEKMKFPLKHPPAMIQSTGARQMYRQFHQGHTPRQSDIPDFFT
ncbi:MULTISPECIES: glycosyltransferase family 2 protein [unclassified Methylobacterium]|jgi:hypothetical protein|uniref:glycosyltransferase family 2 protein n=1 Tax=unclassified Methylobacterium TaxID=2615210 RepID=UPI001353CB85|nr:glycosyltransferase family 2 protein [Methylobacterium sp. 2A]MWV20907.1 glycosyltransferase family 2 protein [Methylobacterium sp. 2A]